MSVEISVTEQIHQNRDKCVEGMVQLPVPSRNEQKYKDIVCHPLVIYEVLIYLLTQGVKNARSLQIPFQ